MWVAVELSSNKARGNPPSPGEEGFVLLLVLWIVALLSVVLFSGAAEVRTGLQLAANYQEAQQCRYLAEAGIHYALGKLAVLKLTEPARAFKQEAGLFPGVWQADQSPHLIELPEGQVEVRIADEAGKLSLNLAGPESLARLFAALGYQENRVPALVAATLDWRDPDNLTRSQGAETPYYQRLKPPYEAKNGPFDLVEELSWVKGFDNQANLAALGNALTVQQLEPGVNINTAPREVIQALGFSKEQADTIIGARRVREFRRLDEITKMVGKPAIQPKDYSISFQSSYFFTILAKGMLKLKNTSHIIKVLVAVNISQPVPWDIVYWLDDYPG